MDPDQTDTQVIDEPEITPASPEPSPGPDPVAPPEPPIVTAPEPLPEIILEPATEVIQTPTPVNEPEPAVEIPPQPTQTPELPVPKPEPSPVPEKVAQPVAPSPPATPPLEPPQQPSTSPQPPPSPVFDVNYLSDDQLRQASALYAKKNQKALSQKGVEKRQAVAKQNIQNITAFIGGHSPASNRTIARALNLPPRRVQHYMQILTHNGTVTATGWGASRQYFKK
ncbi:MAG: hypothetical protein Q7T41_01145 [Candidatus Saccharibacteria bacterium]|nr:hypothetical protein [Candidatus Saccharibacteria bacterium]